MKKSNTLRMIALAAVAAMALPAITSCGSGSGTSSSTPSSSSQAASSSSQTSSQPEDTGLKINTTGLPLVEEPQTITVCAQIQDGRPGNADVRFWQELEEKTNVHVEWADVLQSAWSEKKNVMMAADNQPDIYQSMGMFTDDDVFSLGSGGKFLAVQDYIDEYMPTVAGYFAEHPEWKASSTAPDGNIYSIPNIMEVGGGHFSYGTTPYINQNWLAKVELSFDCDPMTPMTLEQFKEVLTAFKTQDPNGNGLNDEIPWSPSSVSNLYDFGASFGFLRSAVYIKGDKAVWSVTEPEFRAFVEYLHSLWADGLMDVETFTQNGSMYNAKLKSADDTIGFTTAWRQGSTQYAAEDDRFTACAPLDAGNGHAPAWPKENSFSLDRGASVVTSSAENPELCLRWIDNLCTPENSLQLNSAQLVGEHLEVQPDGTYKQLRPIDWNRDGEYNLMPGVAKKFIVTSEEWHKQDVLPPVSVQKDPIDAEYAKYEPKGMELYPASIWMTAEDAKEINIIKSEITAYIDTTFAAWVTEGVTDSSWEEFQKTFSNMGADKALEIYQRYYDEQK